MQRLCVKVERIVRLVLCPSRCADAAAWWQEWPHFWWCYFSSSTFLKLLCFCALDLTLSRCDEKTVLLNTHTHIYTHISPSFYAAFHSISHNTPLVKTEQFTHFLIADKSKPTAHVCLYCLYYSWTDSKNSSNIWTGTPPRILAIRGIAYIAGSTLWRFIGEENCPTDSKQPSCQSLFTFSSRAAASTLTQHPAAANTAVFISSLAHFV